MISKEERAELRGLIEQAVMWPLPWQVCGDADSDALVFSANEEQEEYIAEFTGDRSCDLAVAAVNAAPKLLDALDAADKRIAGLEALRDVHRDARERAEAREEALKARIAEFEAELDKLKGRNCNDENHGLTLDHRCIACLRIENCEERIAQLESWGREDCEPLKRRIAELETAFQSANMIAQAHERALEDLADGCDYVASQTDGYDRIVAEPMIALGLLAVVGTDESGDPTYKRVRVGERPQAIPALPEGGV